MYKTIHLQFPQNDNTRLRIAAAIGLLPIIRLHPSALLLRLTERQFRNAGLTNQVDNRHSQLRLLQYRHNLSTFNATSPETLPKGLMQ